VPALFFLCGLGSQELCDGHGHGHVYVYWHVYGEKYCSKLTRDALVQCLSA
jgi:hypothetical protein